VEGQLTLPPLEPPDVEPLEEPPPTEPLVEPPPYGSAQPPFAVHADPPVQYASS
jgi:hypothetical protein